MHSTKNPHILTLHTHTHIHRHKHTDTHTQYTRLYYAAAFSESVRSGNISAAHNRCYSMHRRHAGLEPHKPHAGIARRKNRTPERVQHLCYLKNCDHRERFALALTSSNRNHNHNNNNNSVYMGLCIALNPACGAKRIVRWKWCASYVQRTREGKGFVLCLSHLLDGPQRDTLIARCSLAHVAVYVVVDVASARRQPARLLCSKNAGRIDAAAD